MPEDYNAPPSEGIGTGALIPESRHQADVCVRNHVIAAMGFGLIPSAVIDIVAISGIEIKMIRDLARIYGRPIPGRLIAYKLMLSVISGCGALYLSNRMKGFLKELPLIGHALYVGAFSITGGAVIYAVGKIFQRHYESGETFLDDSPDAIRAYFKTKYQEGLRLVPALITDKPTPEQG